MSGDRTGFPGRYQATTHNVSPALRQNAAQDTPEEAVLGYIRGDVSYDAAKAAIKAINPNLQFIEFIARMCEAVKLLKRRASDANQAQGKQREAQLAKLDAEVRATHPDASKEEVAFIIEERGLLKTKGGKKMKQSSILKKLPLRGARR
jgi:hypothetical protein